MKNKRGITHLEAVLSVVIFLVGITIIMLIITPRITTKELPEIQMDKLEELFKEETEFSYQWSKLYIETCQQIPSGVVVFNDFYYVNEADLESSITSCCGSYDENCYSFPQNEKIYDINEINTLQSKRYESMKEKIGSDFRIEVRFESSQDIFIGNIPPSHVSVDAKEIEILVSEETYIEKARVWFRIW